MSYKVIDRCKILSFDMSVYFFMKEHFESDTVKIALLCDDDSESFNYVIEIRKMINE